MNSSCILFLFCLVCLFQSPARAELNPLLEKTIKYNAVKVEQVLSVDKLLLASGERVVLIGIDGSSIARRREVQRDAHGFIIPDDDPATPLEDEAFRSVRELLEGKTVRLEFDIERRDDDNMLEAYVYLLDGRMANGEILRQGYANLKLRSPNLKYAGPLRDAYKEARRGMKGLQGQW